MRLAEVRPPKLSPPPKSLSSLNPAILHNNANPLSWKDDSSYSGFLGMEPSPDKVGVKNPGTESARRTEWASFGLRDRPKAAFPFCAKRGRRYAAKTVTLVMGIKTNGVELGVSCVRRTSIPRTGAFGNRIYRLRNMSRVLLTQLLRLR